MKPFVTYISCRTE